MSAPSVVADPTPRPFQPGKTKAEQSDMAKSQKRSNREVRKPKSGKAKSSGAMATPPAFPVNALMHKPKGKL
jgi:hypothetical protein